MPKNKRVKLPNALAYIGLFSAALFIISLAYNVHLRTNIIASLDGSSLGGAGVDAPILAPLGVSLVATFASWYLTKRKPSNVLLVTATILVVGSVIWVFGLNMAVENQYQQLLTN